MKTKTKILRNMMRKLLLISTVLLFFTQGAEASHYMGGEITWTCTPQGNFKFVMKVYRECAGINYPATVNMVTTAPGFSSINMSRIAVNDISPQCNTSGGSGASWYQITCATTTVSNTGGVEEHIYTSDNVYPNGVPLSGVPPPNGWVFSYNSCCRNPCTNILGSNGMDWFLRAIMYPYNNTNVSTCFDNSPKFDQIPSTVICTGNPFTYNHNASDDELDSLAFEWAQPLDNGLNNPITAFAAGYTYLSPLPGPTANPNNVPATVDPYTGEISFTSYTQGAFVTVVKVTAFKCQTKVAEIFREMQVVLLSCNTNTPPDVTPPFPDPTGAFTLFIDTVFAGDLVNFSLSGTDFEFLMNGTPQTMTITATGLQFGAGFTSPSAGCLNAPCATLTPPPPVLGQFGVQTTFNWQTDCSHLATSVGCGVTSNVYNFVIKTSDDFCPAPAINVATITIVVKDKPQLPSPEVRCTEVLPSGDVVLSWPEVEDTMDAFFSYNIYSSPNPGGPFVHIDSIYNIATTTYTHVGAGANAQAIYYYMRTASGCDSNQMAVASPTVSTIYLDVVNPGPALGVANLDWNPPITPLFPSTNGVYEVYREYPLGTWTLIGTTMDTSYVDVITFCDEFINYRIMLEDTLDFDTLGNPIFCKSKSNVDGDQFFDVTPPDPPVIDSVSIDLLNSLAFLSWDVSIADDVIGYIVYREVGGIFIPMDTIWGRTNHTFTDQYSAPCDSAMNYNVVAFDSCWNASAASANQNTILLESSIDVCADGVTLSWNDYNNMTGGLNEYEIYVSENGGLPIFLASTPAATTTYIHTGLTNGSNYCYIVRAVNLAGDVSSTSCIRCELASKPKQPQFLYLRSATVVNNSFARITAHIDTAAYVSNYHLFRSPDGLPGTWVPLTSIPAQYNSPLLSYDDMSASVKAQSYYYYFAVEDSCGVIADTSNIGRTVFLDVVANDDLTNTLSWNDYEEWSGSPNSYAIYRKVDGVLDPLPVISGLGDASSPYIDDVGTVTNSGGDFIYYVEATEGAGNAYSVLDTSISNHVQALQSPRMFVPNAFTPDGNNPVFRPITVFIPITNFEMVIFDRLGSALYQTNDKDAGWNGRVDGEIVPQGVYVYLLRYADSKGDMHERRGTVTVIR